MKHCFILSLLLYFFSIPAYPGVVPDGDTVSFEIYGKISYRNATNVKIVLDPADQKLPDKNTTGVMDKHFETVLFGASVTGWMSIGDMKYTGSAGTTANFILLKELSVVTENGVKKEQFKIGQEVKFTWKKVLPADEAAYKKGMDLLGTSKEQAYLEFRRAVSLNPKNHQAFNMMGMVNDYFERYDSSAYYFSKAYVLDTNNDDYIKNCALSFYSAGDLPMALFYSKKAVLHKPADAESWYIKGLIYFQLRKNHNTPEDQQVVLMDVNKAASLDPSNSFYIIERARIKNFYGDITGACADASKAKEMGNKEADKFIQDHCK